ncbi:hypothetical protein Tco_1118845 [Tanacetum coccineum]
MASMNTRLNIKKLDDNIIQKHRGSKQVGFKQLGPGVEIGVHGVHDEKRVWFEVELQGAQGDREAKVFQSGLSKVFWAEDTTRSTYLVNRSPSSAIGFKKPIDMLVFFGWLASIKQGMLKPVKVKCIFLGFHKSIVGNKLWRLDDVTSKVVLYRNIGFNESGEYKKTFIGSGVVEKIYAHESLTFNDTVACEVISKWKAGLKDDMYARSDVYVLSNGCRKCSNGYYWESTPGIKVGSLSRDCDVEKNGKWSCIYAVGSQEYQMVCTRLDITSANVGMLDKFDRGLQTDIQVFVDFDYAMVAYMTLTGAWKKEIWLKGLLAESGYELSLVAGIAIGALVKGGSRSEVPAQVEGAAYRVLPENVCADQSWWDCLLGKNNPSGIDPTGWLSGQHINAWSRLILSERPSAADWTIAPTELIGHHKQEPNLDRILDLAGTLDGTKEPFIPWANINRVFIPINVAVLDYPVSDEFWRVLDGGTSSVIGERKEATRYFLDYNAT